MKASVTSQWDVFGWSFCTLFQKFRNTENHAFLSDQKYTDRLLQNCEGCAFILLSFPSATLGVWEALENPHGGAREALDLFSALPGGAFLCSLWPCLVAATWRLREWKASDGLPVGLQLSLK